MYQYWISDKEYWSIISNQVPVAFLCVELHGKTTRITSCVSTSRLTTWNYILYCTVESTKLTLPGVCLAGSQSMYVRIQEKNLTVKSNDTSTNWTSTTKVLNYAVLKRGGSSWVVHMKKLHIYTQALMFLSCLFFLPEFWPYSTAEK